MLWPVLVLSVISELESSSLLAEVNKALRYAWQAYTILFTFQQSPWPLRILTIFPSICNLARILGDIGDSISISSVGVEYCRLLFEMVPNLPWRCRKLSNSSCVSHTYIVKRRVKLTDFRLEQRSNSYLRKWEGQGFVGGYMFLRPTTSQLGWHSILLRSNAAYSHRRPSSHSTFASMDVKTTAL